MRAGDERGVVVEAEVASAFVVVEAELAFQLSVVELDRPAQPREAGESLTRCFGGEIGAPVVGRGVFSLRPFDDQPLLARRLVVVAHRMGCDDADEREAARALLTRRRRPD